MRTSVDYLIVGSGLTGGTIARLLTDDRREVLVVERRSHVGGNVHDSVHASGIRVHTYGPHYFRCSSIRIWEFVQRFASFYRYEATLKSLLNGHYGTWPINEAMFEAFPDWQRALPTGLAANFEEACLQKMPRPLYEAFVKGYTRRQWGVEPHLLGSGLANRVRINARSQLSLTPHCTYQGLPTKGYADFTAKLLDRIPCHLGIDYLKHTSQYKARKAIIFTGSVDEFFNFDAGRLGYRGQRRLHRFLPDCRWHQPCAQVNHPDCDGAGAIRTLEWKYLMRPDEHKRIAGTLITQEYPYTPDRPDEFEYPVPLPHNLELYRHYRARAAAVRGLIVCGRLGRYRYFDMDQAIGHGMSIAQRLLDSHPNHTELSTGLICSHKQRMTVFVNRYQGSRSDR